MLLALEDQLGREEAHELQELFKLVDKDGGGNISQVRQTECVEFMRTFWFVSYRTMGCLTACLLVRCCPLLSAERVHRAAAHDVCASFACRDGSDVR